MTDQSFIKKRQRRPDARPGEILAAALAQFSEKGFSAARMEDIAVRAGVSKGVIYLYFPDKVALLKALVQQTIGGQISAATEVVAQNDGPVAPLLRFLASMYANRIATTDLPFIIKLVIAESRAHPEIGRFYLDNVIMVAMPLLQGLIARGVASGEFRRVDPHLTVKCLLGPMLLSAIWRSVFEPLGAEAVDATALATQHLDIFLKGLRP